LVYFKAVADAGSFTKAAELLGIGKTVVSQQVARLEAELKTSLLLRTTRRVETTEAGKLLHARCITMLHEAGEAFEELAQSNAQPSGLLKVAAPHDYGTSVIAPVAVRFCQKYVGCRVELLLGDARIDLVASQIDLAIRVGWLADSSLQARRINSFRQCLVATPELARRLDPLQLDDLPKMPFIANAALKDPLVWHFSKLDGEQRTIRLAAALMINTAPAVLEATLAGGGMSILPDFLIDEHLKAGRLANLLPQWSLPSGGIFVVYPAARFRPPKVTKFVDLMTENPP
jgi:DNA-binding transcriptional LysR family regulator